MAQVIYTGENYQKPIRSEGRAMQAMSQFTQQHQMRKEADLQRSRQDRDMMAKYMQLDPVYATSVALQKKIAGEMDSFTDSMTDVNKRVQSKGGPNTMDLQEMQQLRAMSMARMNGWKATDEALNKAQAAYAREPWKYDKPEYDESVAYTQRTGETPEGGYLFKAVQDPREMYKQYVSEHIKSTGGAAYQRGEFVPSPEGGGYYPETLVYRGQDQFPEEQVQEGFMNIPEVDYHTQKYFDRLPKAQQEPFLRAANGDSQVAANMWLKKGTAGQAYIPQTRENWQKPSATITSGLPQTYQGKEEAKTYVTDKDVQVVGGNTAFSRTNVTGAMIATDGKDGIRFASTARPISVPAGQLTFSDPEFTLDPTARVWVRPNVAADGKLEFGVDTKETGMVTKIVTNINDIPLDLLRGKKFKIITDPTTKEETYSFKEKVPENMSAVGDIKVVGPMLKTDYEGTFEERYKEWFPEKEKEAAPTTNKYGL